MADIVERLLAIDIDDTTDLYHNALILSEAAGVIKHLREENKRRISTILELRKDTRRPRTAVAYQLNILKALQQSMNQWAETMEINAYDRGFRNGLRSKDAG